MTSALPLLSDLFGSCRGFLQREELSVDARAQLWALLKRAYTLDKELYAQTWVPYLSDFPQHWQRPLVKLDDVYALPQARELAPFARFTVSSQAMHQWLLENDSHVYIAAALELYDEVKPQDPSIELWMSAPSPAWRASGERFEVFGVTSSGSLCAMWRRPSDDELEEPAVVLFGDEGEIVGIAPSLTQLARQLAYTFDIFDPSKLIYDFRQDADTERHDPHDFDISEDTRRYDEQGHRILRRDVSSEVWRQTLSQVQLPPRAGDPPTMHKLQLRFAKQIGAIFGHIPARESMVEPVRELTAAFKARVSEAQAGHSELT